MHTFASQPSRTRYAVYSAEIRQPMRWRQQLLSPKATLRFMDVGRARGEDEQLVCRILETEGPCSVSQVVEQAAKEMYYDELKHGGWAADTGFWGPRLFGRDVCALLESMKDRCLTVEGENDK